MNACVTDRIDLLAIQKKNLKGMVFLQMRGASNARNSDGTSNATSRNTS